jgi:2-methylisocitrate lyase-like PEP mutase family enzyme
LQDIGYRIAIFPGGTVRALAHAMRAYFASLVKTGSTAAFRPQMLDLAGINDVVGTTGLLDQGKIYEGTSNS